MRIVHALPMIALFAFATPALAEEYIIMKVGTQDVSSAEAQRFWEGLFPAGQAPAFESVKSDVRDKVLRGVMAERLLYAEAQKQGIDKSEAMQRQLEDMKRKVIVRTLLDSKTADSITETDLKKEYEALVATMKDEHEVRARHILLPSEAEAKDARKKIEEGKGFEEVARTLSKDAGSAKQGGDLGYFTRDKMVKEFADAAFAMKKGEISAPVKSSFGWHIIKVEDVRNIQAPTFAEVKDTLRSHLQEKKLNDYVTGLVKTADVKVFDSQGKPVAFDKNVVPQPVANAPKAEKKTEKPETVKTEKTEKTEKSEKPAKTVEKSDKAEKAEKPEKSEKTDKAEKTEKPEAR